MNRISGGEPRPSRLSERAADTGYYVKAKAGNLEETSTRAGFFGGGGINLNLGGTLFIGVEARYLVLTAPTPAPTPHSPSATANINLDGVLATGNLGFRFNPLEEGSSKIWMR
jgi:hypothetical protein